MSVQNIETYQEDDGKYCWRITGPGGIIADSGMAYSKRADMLKSLFSIFFGDYDESFLALYAEWNPDNSGHAWQSAPTAAARGGFEGGAEANMTGEGTLFASMQAGESPSA